MFTDGQELEIVQHIKDMEARFYGLTKKYVRSLAFQLFERNSLKHKFNKKTLNLPEKIGLKVSGTDILLSVFRHLKLPVWPVLEPLIRPMCECFLVYLEIAWKAILIVR